MNKKDSLFKTVVGHGLDAETAHQALNETHPHAIAHLLDFVRQLDDLSFMVDEYIEVIISSADDNDRLTDILEVLIEKPTAKVDMIAKRLRRKRHPDVIPALRKLDQIEWLSRYDYDAVGDAIFQVLYYYSEHALDDESRNVRYIAATFFKMHEKTDILMKALDDDDPHVVQVAAWYMGQKHINRASDALCQALQRHQDVETLRAVIWSLRALQVEAAIPMLQPLLSHENPMLRRYVKEAIDYLS